MNILITTTWNSATLVETFLDHYRALGFEQVLVMDFDSTDGTPDLLRSDRYRDLVRLVAFPGLPGLDSSNLMLAMAQEEFGPDSACLFCDPDELLVVTPDLDVPALLAGSDVVVLPRHNVTGARSTAAADPDSLTAVQGLTLRIDGQRASPARGHARGAARPTVDLHGDPRQGARPARWCRVDR